MKNTACLSFLRHFPTQNQSRLDDKSVSRESCSQRDRCARRNRLVTTRCLAMCDDQYVYLQNGLELLERKEVSGEMGSTQYWNLFQIPPPLCKKLSHVRIDQCGVDSFLDRNIDARSSSFTTPSFSRFTESPCRSNLIINFDTSRLPGTRDGHLDVF